MTKSMIIILSFLGVQEVYSMDCLRWIFTPNQPPAPPQVEIGSCVQTHDGFLWKIEQEKIRVPIVKKSVSENGIVSLRISPNSNDSCERVKYVFTATAEIVDRARAIRLVKAPINYNGGQGSAVTIVGFGTVVYSFNKLKKENAWEIDSFIVTKKETIK